MRIKLFFRQYFPPIAALLLLVAGPADLFGFTSDQNASLVIGQPDMAGNAANNGGVGANTLNAPRSVFRDGSRLFIADASNNRVLIFNSIPTANHASADVVIGQPNMTSNSANQGGGAGPNTLYLPSGVCVWGTRLFIADTINSRVLIYNTIPTANDAGADVVVGQPNMTSNAGGIGANALNFPIGVYTDGSKLFIADYSNHRVLIYNTIPTTNGASADVVVGQPNMTSNAPNASGLGAASLYYPAGVCADASRLYIADSSNYRVLIYDTIPAADHASANVVVGQMDMTTFGWTLSAQGLRNSFGVSAGGGRLFIGDYTDNRVTVFNAIPSVNYAGADVVVGQPDMTSNGPNQGHSPAANTLLQPYGVFNYGNQLWVADSNNHRVMLYEESTPVPTLTPTPVSVVPEAGRDGVSVYPSPGRDSVNFIVKVAKPSAVKVTVYNVALEKVAEFGGFSSGPTAEFTWNCRQNAAGCYLARISVEGKKTSVVKVMLVK